MCDSPRLTAESELSDGPRGGFEAGGGVRPRRLPRPTAEGQWMNVTHPARRPWVRLMLRLAAVNGSLSQEDARIRTRLGHEREGEAARESCLQAFESAREELRTMPAIY